MTRYRICYLVSLLAFVAAAVVMWRADDKGFGILAIIIAAVIARVLLIDVAGAADTTESTETESADLPADSSASECAAR